MVVLAFETSCDETSAALWSPTDGIISLVVAGQEAIHAKYGGIVPELASRRHLEIITPVLSEVFEKAGASFREVDLVAVTKGPGLIGSLLVGVSFAKAFSWVKKIPLVGVHHLLAHAMAAHLEYPELSFPYLALVISGGHTSLMDVRSPVSWEVIGRTRDDAAGEAFDKVAKLMNLGYPGGPVIDRLAQTGDPAAYSFPRPLMKDAGLDFSFSGLKTAVARVVDREQPGWERYPDLAASFQASVVDLVIDRVGKAVEKTGHRRVVIGGGVASNQGLRNSLSEAASRDNYRLFLPSQKYCVDNALMVAVAGWGLYQAGKMDNLGLNPFATGQDHRS